MNRHVRIVPALVAFAFCGHAAASATVNIATVANGDMVVMQQLSHDFERSHPGTVLTWTVLDEATLRDQVASDLKAGKSRFDVVTVGTYEAPIWGKRGWLEALDLPPSYDAGDLLKPVRDGLSYMGKLYAVPFYGESSMTYYRKDLFAENGLTMPAHPTYADIRRFAAALTDRKHDRYGICLRGKAGWGENMAFLGTMANAYGAQWFDMQWRPTLDTPAWRAAIGDYVDLLQRYGPPNPQKNGFNENLALFSKGSCAMWIDATVAAGILFNPQESQVADKLGFAPAPEAVTAKGSHWLWSWALGVPSTSANKAAATEFVAWATSKEYVGKVAELMGWGAVPPGTRQSTYTNPSYRRVAPYADFVVTAIGSADPVHPTLHEAPYTGVQFVGIPAFGDIGNAVGAHVSDLLEKKQGIDETLKANQRDAERIYRASEH